MDRVLLEQREYIWVALQFFKRYENGKSKNKKNGGNINIKRNILMLISLSATLLYVAFGCNCARFARISWHPRHLHPMAGGILINGTPLFFELSVDVVFPIAEGLTTTLTLVNNVGGLVFLLLPSIGIEIQPTWIVLATAESCLVAFLCLAYWE